VKDDLVTSRGSQHRHSAPRRAGAGFIGVYQDCGMAEEKRPNEPAMPVAWSGSPRTREACAPLLLGFQQVTDAQRNEGIRGRAQESDPFIVLRDGNADHMGKGWAARQRKRSTHHEKGMLSQLVSSSPLATGDRYGHLVWHVGSSARRAEEPCAGKPHAGICEGGAG
jgi:hypothetical protein